MWLGDAILGGQDGLVNILGVVLGVAAATGSARIVVAAGLAAAVAEAASMAAVAYTSSVAAGDLYRSERAREYRHIELAPAVERDEIRAIYARKGFDGELLDRIVETITSNPDVWVAVMMAEEHGLARVDRQKSLHSAVVVGIASLIGSFVPLVPFMVLSAAPAAVASVAFTVVALFAFGMFKAHVTVGRPLRSGVELALIGTISSLLGYGIGVLFRVPMCP
jgi:VIT1/CCC1 family predicted Fe2+/Mn2+ transporter